VILDPQRAIYLAGDDPDCLRSHVCVPVGQCCPMCWVNAQAPCISKCWVFVPSNDWTDTTSYRRQVSPNGKIFPASPLPVHSLQTDTAPLPPDRAKFFSRSGLVGAIAPLVPVIPVSVKSCLGRSEHPADKNGARALGEVARPPLSAVGSHCQVWRRRKWKLSIRSKCGSSESHGWRIREKKLK